MNASTELLKELRIDRTTTPPAPGSRRRWWIFIAIAVLLGIGLAAWLLRPQPIEVQTAPAVALGEAGDSASVLDASGYVVARRMATVSAKINSSIASMARPSSWSPTIPKPPSTPRIRCTWTRASWPTHPCPTDRREPR